MGAEGGLATYWSTTSVQTFNRSRVNLLASIFALYFETDIVSVTAIELYYLHQHNSWTFSLINERIICNSLIIICNKCDGYSIVP